MLGRIDEWMREAANRLASRLQENFGLTMPQILLQAATATILATVLAIFATVLMREPFMWAITLVFGAITITAFWQLLQRYSRDAQRDWSSDLARDYMVRAIGATEGQRRIRQIGLIFALIAFGLCFAVVRFRPYDLVDMTMIFLVFSTMGHMYLTCAEPRPPGSQRRQPRLALATGTR